MHVLTLDDRLSPSDQVVMRELAGESVILDLQSGSYYGLNGVGTRVWGVLANGGSLRDANETLANEFDAPPAEIEAELLKFAADLQSHGLCRLIDAR